MTFLIDTNFYSLFPLHLSELSPEFVWKSDTQLLGISMVHQSFPSIVSICSLTLYFLLKSVVKCYRLMFCYFDIDISGMVDYSLLWRTVENCLEIGSRYKVNNVYWMKQFRSKQSDQSTLSAKIHFNKTLFLHLSRSKRFARFLSLSLSLWHSGATQNKYHKCNVWLDTKENTSHPYHSK